MTIQSRIPCTGEKTCQCGCCGGLECLCRPRFFAGQLLTEEDLNRLDRYVRGRHRLHNLAVHGHGVSGGLKVLCDPCGSVLVTHGHAISPCGEDIVVCEDVAVPVCDLIAKCRKSERHAHDCDPPRRMPLAHDCEDLEEEWVLAIKYDERPSRGIVPLRTAGSSACASCGGGGAGCDCDDCGCDACCETKAKSMPKPRAAPATCEPTVICEGYRFCVYRKPEPDGTDDDIAIFDPDAPLIRALTCCIEVLISAMPVMPAFDPETGQADRQALHAYCCRLKKNLTDYFRTHPHTNCEVVSRLGALRCPDPNDPQAFDQAITEALLSLFAVWLDAIRQCFCLALLPPAPEASCEDRVPLATVRVTVRDCKVLSVCNWTTERDLLMSWTALEYWVGGLGLWTFMREALDAFCCNDLLGIFDDFLEDDFGDQPVLADVAQPPQPGVATPPQPGFATIAAATPPPTESDTIRSTGSRPPWSFADRLDRTFARVAPRMAVDLPRLDIAGIVAGQAGAEPPRGLSDILARSSPKFRFAGRPGPLSAAERESLPGALTMEFIGKPLIAGLFGDRRRAAPAAAPAYAEPAADLGALQAELESQKLDIALLKQALAAVGTGEGTR
jgi:hypothetical protein